MLPDEYRVAIDKACLAAKPLTIDSATQIVMQILQPDPILQNQFKAWFQVNGQKYVDRLNATH